MNVEIIAHRGFWLKTEEKNTLVAFHRALENGFGIETDIRDFNGDLVVSHDIPNTSCQPLPDLFDLYNKAHGKYPLALNIKADGLSLLLKKQLSIFNIANYFVFDMSVPETLAYIRLGLAVFTRQSEYELTPSLYQKSEGLWLDEFNSSWINLEIIKEHFMNLSKQDRETILRFLESL